MYQPRFTVKTAYLCTNFCVLFYMLLLLRSLGNRESDELLSKEESFVSTEGFGKMQWRQLLTRRFSLLWSCFFFSSDIKTSLSQ